MIQDLRFKNAIKIIAIFTILVFVFANAFSLQAAEFSACPPEGPCEVNLTNPLAGVANNFPELLAYILDQAIFYGGLLLGLVIVYGAGRIMFSAGDPKEYEVGKNVIIYGIIGYGLIILADVIASVIADIVSGAAGRGF